MLLRIEHHLRFRYSAFVRESHMELRVEPRTLQAQSLHDFDIAIGPHAQPSRHEDWLGNALHWFSITDYHDRVEVLCRSLVETSPSIQDPFRLDHHFADEPPLRQTWEFFQFGGPVVDRDGVVIGMTRSYSTNPGTFFAIHEDVIKESLVVFFGD